MKQYRHIPTGKIAVVHFMQIDGKEVIRCYNQGEKIDFDFLSKGNDWEEIPDDPEYTILSLLRKDKKQTSSLRSDNKFLNDKFINYIGGVLLSEINWDYWDIKSIKRLSDGEIFTIGDNINGPCGSYPLIKIEIDNSNIWMYYRGGKFAHSIHTYRLEEIKKVEKIFTTEDGVDIYEGDEYWLNDGWYRVILRKGGNGYKPNLSDKAFSTKEKAEEYILMNKPCLSIKDILNLEKNYNPTIIISEADLKTLVKTKL